MSDPGAFDLGRLFQGPGLRSAEQREFMRLLHELQSHEAEVELQNEALERTRAELALAEERYFELFELAPVGYAMLDADGRIVAANLALAKLLVTDRVRLVGSMLAERLLSSDRPHFATFLADAFGGSPKKGGIALDVVGSGGRLVPLMLEAETTRSRDGTLRVALVDRTELCRAEGILRERQAHLQAILDTVVDGIVTVGEDGKIGSCNATAAELFGTSPGWLVGQRVNVIMPRFIALAENPRNASAASASELVAKRVDGSEFSVEVGVSRLREAGSMRFVAVIRDISDRKRRDAELEEALARFRQIAEHIDDAIFVVEAKSGRPLYVNPAFGTIWGRSSEEALGEPWPRLAWVHEGDREAVDAAADQLRFGAPFDVQYRILRPDGSVRTVRCRASLLADQDRITGIVHDMTEELSLQAELRQAQRLEAIGTLASGIAHDFNNLLMGVGGCAQLALRHLRPSQRAYAYIRRAADAILRGASLTRQILRFSDTRRTTDAPAELDTIVLGARDLVRSLMGDQVIVSVVAKAPGLFIAAEAGDIEQVLLNLASNARDAMPDGGFLTVRTEVQQGGVVALSVQDTGFGMSEETKRRVFEPFFTTKEVGKGTGLGLSTVFAAVRRMGGSIHVESAVGAGTTFTLHFPVVIPDAAALPEAREEVRPGAGQTILIVDDDPLIRMTVETHVEALGYRALSAASVTDALRVYRESEQRIDVILTDIMMPGLLGSDLTRVLKMSPPEVKVIFMSAHPRAELIRQQHLTEESHLLSKPFDSRDLGMALQHALEKKPRAAQFKLRIFLVDDDRDVVDALSDLFRMEGYTVATALHTADALREIPVFLPDVVLCDLNVDEQMGGLDLVQTLREVPELGNTVFWAVTGLAPSQCRAAALEAGFEDVLPKPLAFDELSQRLASRVRH
jgi:PAS domain S-box-containing protein